MRQTSMMASRPSGENPPGPGLVRIGSLEVDPADLRGAESSLWDVIGDRELVMRSPDDVLDLPRQGWRQIFPPWDYADNPREVFAAPHPNQRNAWVLVFLHWIGEAWTVSTDPGPVPVQRCRVDRRAGLKLRWPADMTAAAGTLPGLSIDLVNTADTGWANDVGDHMTVHGWILGPDGEALKPGMLVFTHAPLLPDLEAGERMPLRVNLVTSDIEDFAPGRYIVVAELLDLDLRSAPGTLVLTEPPTPTDIR